MVIPELNIIIIIIAEVAFLFFYINFHPCDARRCEQQEVILDDEGTSCSLARVPRGEGPPGTVDAAA